MPKYSTRSKEQLQTCHPDLQRLFNEVIRHTDCTILEGVRSVASQKFNVSTGKSKTMNSLHLKQPDGYAHAVDVISYPIDWNDWKRHLLFIGFVLGTAKQMGINCISGVDWDSDFNVAEHSFLDAPHFELRSK